MLQSSDLPRFTPRPMPESCRLALTGWSWMPIWRPFELLTRLQYRAPTPHSYFGSKMMGLPYILYLDDDDLAMSYVPSGHSWQPQASSSSSLAMELIQMLRCVCGSHVARLCAVSLRCMCSIDGAGQDAGLWPHCVL